ncbi:hypothetical protein P154DRAFT_169662 [Amniculicola lignicola CBS 123094]|uniref:Uncharacterized protein n=1 Tax=Amniculicola lignicola CBS 123094 TaxID=1392246 RepID=A0A6A5WKI9_9PLEO|nr:hypothetical protein P154DRAFT_169662 [Amniculicola lignicola CBS 123094]
MSRTHSRNASDDSTTLSSYNLIMEHILQYPGSYEIPLRTMYTLNCTPRAQPLPKDLSLAPSSNGSSNTVSPISGQFAWTDSESSTMNFASTLMNHMVSLPAQPSSLPPAFIVSFVSRVFHPSLSLVDFPQALTALDYLRDLETRRRKEVAAAFDRLGIHADSFATDVDDVAERYPGVALWAKNIQGKNKKAEGHYAHLYMGVRRWIMINELSLQPFNKLNCMGMLNTLLPPQPPPNAHGAGKLPAPLLTHEFLKEERDGFFEYIRLVQKQGPIVLKDLVELNKKSGDDSGWDDVQRSVDKYLRVTKNMIDDCTSTSGTDDFTPSSVEAGRKGKKTDSGVSFGSDRRPSTAASIGEKPLPVAPLDSKTTTPKGLSKLERITREFRRMRVKTRPDVEEMIKIERQPAEVGETKARKSLKKARSMASMANFRNNNGSSTSLTSRVNSDAVPYNPEEMKRYRLMYEASTTLKGHKNVV